MTEVVLAPGSRNAPLSFAAYDAAAAGLLRLHTRVDERTAGFLALGLTKVGARAAVVCTSGTAVANLHPAVLEAAHAGLPLVVVTADRPARLRGTGANQTTDQVGIFGPLVATVDLAGSDELPVVIGGSTAPVHLNVQLDDPLVPPTGDAGWSMVPRLRTPAIGTNRSLTTRILTVRYQTACPQGPAHRRRRRRRRRPAGAGPGARTRAGRCWPSRPAARAPATTPCAATGCCWTADSGSGSSGWSSSATPRSPARSPGCSPATTSRCGRGRPAGVWPERPFPVDVTFDRLEIDGPADDPRGSRSGERPTATSPHASTGSWPPRRASRRTRSPARWPAALPAGGLLFVGASSPIRDLDLMVPKYAVGDRRKVIANRGLSGIDGTVSTAIGAALGRPRSTRCLALMGDVTFLHDANGLVLGPDEPAPDLTIVVVNDDGGSIFSMLEQGAEEYADRYDRLFGTPHGVDLASLCAATRTPHWKVGSLPELEQALASPNGGIEVVEVAVRRDNRRDLDARIRALAP